MTSNALAALGAASILGTIALAVLARLLSAALRRLTDTVAAVSVASQTAPESAHDTYMRVRKIELEVKAMDDDLGSLRESVKRWQGRVNRQSARDAQPVATDGDPEEMGQIELLAAGGATRAPAGTVKPGHRPRLVPRLRTNNRG